MNYNVLIDARCRLAHVGVLKLFGWTHRFVKQNESDET